MFRLSCKVEVNIAVNSLAAVMVKTRVWGVLQAEALPDPTRKVELPPVGAAAIELMVPLA